MTPRLLFALGGLLFLAGCPKAVPPSSPTTRVEPPPPSPAPVPPALRLPEIAAPLRYLARLSVDPSQPGFEGELTVELEVKQTSSLLWLNGTGLKVSQASLEREGTTQPLEVVPGDEDFFALRGEFVPGPATLKLRWSGTMDRERSRGLYTQQEPGDGGWYAYTFFEPIDARRVFPCFDEPSYKVPWTLELRTPKGNLAFANSQLASRTEEEGWTRFVFEPTPPMPSYLVAFGVGPFELVEVGPSGQKQVPTRLVIPRGRAAETRYAKEVTPKVVAALESFLGLPYPYDKLDVLVVPRFWGTMEHPGLVAMGQPLTLIKPEEETPQRKQAYANILIHELGHYWFGDLVTLAWWDDTWLNEALTTWLDMRVTERLEPGWNWLVEHQAMSRASAMRTDALLSAQPLRTPVTTREEISGSFENSITYDKGASVLGMLEGWVGPEKFRGLLREYLTRHSWKNARTEDLLEAVERGAGTDARTVFESFIRQPGVPLLTAQVQCEDGRPRLSLSQERWVAGGPVPEQEWVFPVCLRSDLGGGEFCTVMDAPQKEATLPWTRCPKWVVANAGGRGYYRVRHTAAEAERLLLSAKLPLNERVAVVSDLAALAARGDVPPAQALALVPPLARDPQQLMLRASLQLVGTARYDLLSEEGRQRFSGFVRRAYGARASQVGWTPRVGETEEDLKTRVLLLGLMGEAGQDPTVLKEARGRLEAWLKDRRAVPEAMLPTVLSMGARQGDAALFEKILQQARETKDRREKSRLLSTLGSFRDPALNRRALELLLSTELDLRETGGILWGSLSTRETREQAWTFLEEHFDALASRLRDDELSWLAGLVGGVCEPARLARAERVFREKGPQYGLVLRALDNASEQARQCIENARKTVPEVERFLQTQGAVQPARR